MEQLKLDVEVKNKITDRLKNQLQDWTCLYPFFEGPEWIKIKNELKPDFDKISTAMDSWFRAFTVCSFESLKVVFLGLCPYHTVDSYTKRPVADGLAFSTDTRHSQPPSLFKIYKAMEDDLWNGMNLNMARCNDLTFLAEQGVLLGNAGLTTIFGTAAYHTQVWEPFTRFLLKTLSAEKKDLAFVGFGSVANQALQAVDKEKHLVIELEHPAFAARESRSWRHEEVFSRIDEHLSRTNQKCILWDKQLMEEEPPF